MFSNIKTFFEKSADAAICKICGKPHSELLDIVALSPDNWNDSYKNCPGNYLDEDLCIINEQDYFIKGIIQVPIIGTNKNFGWGIWISQKKENFEMYRENFESSDIGPFFGWLSTEISYYKETTINLKTRACFRGNGLRPIIEIAPCDHEIYANQNNGITWDSALEMNHFYNN